MTDLDTNGTDGSTVDWTHQTAGSFDDWELPDSVREALAILGYEAPTPVQAAVYEPALGGHDIVIQSKTGSGKTAAFAVPLAVRLGEMGSRPQALVLAPTRELAQQVDREVSELIRGAGHQTVIIIGGVGYGPQNDGLSAGASVVIGTPGRVLDMLRRGAFDPTDVRTVVLDEADEMLSMGFWDEVTSILDHMPKQRQTILLSATLPEEIERAAKHYLNEPERIELAGDVSTVLGIDHLLYYPESDLLPLKNLLYVLEVEGPERTLLFCNTKNDSEAAAAYLRRFGFRCDVLHGDLSQRDRNRAMGRLRRGEVDILTATDIAARGIDVSGLSHVVNHGLPEYPEVFVHRVGRTGRIGKSGTSITLLSGRDMSIVTTVQRRYGVTFIRRQLPGVEEILNMQTERLIERLKADAQGVEFEMYVPVAEKLCETEEGRRAVGYLLRQHFSNAPAPGARPSSAGPSTVRLYVACATDEADDAALREALSAVEGVTAGDILGIERQATAAFVEVLPAAADKLLADDVIVTVGDLELRIEKARTSQRRSGGRGDRGRSSSGRGRSGGSRRR